MFCNLRMNGSFESLFSVPQAAPSPELFHERGLVRGSSAGQHWTSFQAVVEPIVGWLGHIWARCLQEGRCAPQHHLLPFELPGMRRWLQRPICIRHRD